MNPMIGQLLFTMTLALGPDWRHAEGQCMSIPRFQKLAHLLHHDNHWLYGQCGPRMFRLPNFKPSDLSAPTPVIRVQ